MVCLGCGGGERLLVLLDGGFCKHSVVFKPRGSSVKSGG